MKKNIFKIVSLLSLIIIPFNVFASNISGELVMDSDVTKGEDFNVAIKLMQDGDDKIDVFQGIVDFDETVFSGIDEESFEVQNGWADFEYNKETHALIVINKYGSSLNEDIITFNLNLNENVKPSSTNIAIRNMIVANENGDISLNDVSGKVEVNLIPSDLSNNNTVSKNIKPLQNTPVRIYYTLTLILLELMIAFILVLLYKSAINRLSSKAQRRFLGGALCVIEVFALSILFKVDDRKGDLNNDKEINYSDVLALSNHIINTKMLSNFRLENADMNGDGMLTPADIAILLRKTYTKVEYAANLSDAILEDNAYEKNSVVDIRFLADVTDNEKIQYVLIGGKKYKVERASKNSNEYIIKMPLDNQSKEYNYNVTEIILANGRSAKVDYKTSVVVLKDAPTLTQFATKENLENGTVSVALTINDDDNAITDAKYELVDSAGNIAKNGDLNKGKNVLELSLNNAVNYKFNIKINYNRGMNSGEYYGFIEDSYDLRIVTDYKFKMSNLKLNQNGIETKNLEKDLATTLTFSSSNISGYAPKKVNIGGREYYVNRVSNNRYSVNIPNTLLNGAPITISKVILSNGKVILTKVSADYKLLSKKPVIGTVNAYEDANNSKVNVNFDIADEDNTISDVLVKLFDANGNLISSQNTSRGNYNVSLDTKDTNKYIVRIYASYNRLANSTEFSYKDELLYETSLDAKIKAYVNSYSIDNIYPEKNSVIKLNYNVTSNYKDSVSKVIVNNVIYDVRKVSINNYQVELNVGDIAGIKNYKTQKVIFANGMEANVANEAKLDVLKEYPMLDNLEINENTLEGKINLIFDFFDKDNAFTSGIVKLSNKETGEEVARENIIIGKNNMEFVLENAVKYNIDVLIDGNLDTRELNPVSPNEIHEYNLYSTEYRIINDYKLEITDISAYKDGEKTDFLNKDEKIKLGFASNNISEYVPVKVKVDGEYYDLAFEDGLYTFEIDGYNESGVKTLRFESVILSNLKEITTDCNKTIEILKSVPIISEAGTLEDDNTITVKLNKEDYDNVLTNLKAVVVNEKDEEIFNSSIDNEITFNKNDSSKYIIKVYGDYDLDTNELIQDQNQFINQELFTKTIEKVKN